MRAIVYLRKRSGGFCRGIWLAAAVGLICGCAGNPAGDSPGPGGARGPGKTTVARQIYDFVYMLQTNSMAAAANNNLPEELGSVSCQKFVQGMDKVCPGMEYRLEVEPFVADLFLVDSRLPGATYGCASNTIFAVRAGNLIDSHYSQGVAWVLPIGPNDEKAALIISTAGIKETAVNMEGPYSARTPEQSRAAPSRTTVFSFDDPMHAKLIYDSFVSTGDDAIDYLCGLKMVDNNHFILHEGWLPGLLEHSLQPRTFLLEVTDTLDVEVGR